MLCHLRPFVVLFLLVSSALGGCQKRGVGFGLNHPALTPADVSRERLVARLLVPSFDRTSATVDQLRGRGALPFGAAELRSMLLARLSLPEDALKLVDTSRPMALAYVAAAAPAGRIEAAPLVAGAVALRAPEGAGAFVEALGTLVGSDRDVIQLRRGDGEPVWVLHLGQSLAWASSREALVEAGAHALEARTEAADDLVVTGYPAAWARSQGVDLRGSHESMKARVLEQLGSSDGPRSAADQASLDAVLDFVLRPMPDTDAIDLRFGLVAENGAQIALRAYPRSGSAFAARTAVRKPYSLQSAPQGPATPAPVALVAVGEDPAFVDLLVAVLEAQGRAGVAGAAQTAQRLRPLITRLSGALVGTLRAAGTELTADLALPLRAGAAPALVLDELGKLADDPELSPLLRQLYRLGPVRTSRADQQLRAELGSDLTVVATVARGQLLLASEPGAGQRLAAFTAGPALPAAAESSPAVRAALEETRGKDGVVFVEVLGLLRPVVTSVVRGPSGRMLQGLLSMPGLADKKMPCWIGLAGGTALMIDVRVPIETLTNASGMLGLFGREG